MDGCIYTLKETEWSSTALWLYCGKLADWETNGGEMPQPPTAEDFATPDIPIGAELAKYTFDTDHITYWEKLSDYSGADGYLKLDITHADWVKIIAANVDLQGNLQPIPAAEQDDSYLPEHFLDFHNGTVLAYFADYLWIIETPTFGDAETDFSLDDTAIGPYYNNDALGKVIQGMPWKVYCMYTDNDPAVTLVQWE